MSLIKTIIICISLFSFASLAKEPTYQEKAQLAQLACRKAKEQKVFELTETRQDKEYYCHASALTERGKVIIESTSKPGVYILKIRFADHFDLGRQTYTNFRNCAVYVNSRLDRLVSDIDCNLVGDFPTLKQ